MREHASYVCNMDTDLPAHKMGVDPSVCNLDVDCFVSDQDADPSIRNVYIDPLVRMDQDENHPIHISVFPFFLQSGHRSFCQ